MNIKFRTLAAIMSSLAIVSVGQAGPVILNVPFSTNGSGTANFTLTSFTYQDGNALAIGGNAAAQLYEQTATPIPLGGGSFVFVGGTQVAFDTVFQSRVAALNNDTTNPVTSISGADFSLAARITEVVTSEFYNATTNTFTANYSLISAPQDYVQLFYNNPPTANDQAGTGFNSGTLILSASPTPSGPAGASDSSFGTTVGSSTALDQLSPNYYPGQNTITGSGGATINASVNSVNPNFFVGQTPSTITFTVAQAIGQSDPFGQVQPSARFLATNGSNGAVGATPTPDGAGLGLYSGVPSTPLTGSPAGGTLSSNASIGTINGAPIGSGGGSDFQFETTGTESFLGPTPTPAPGTIIILGIGAACMGAWQLRRGKRSPQPGVA